MDVPAHVLTELGAALVAFGTALQLAGTRLQAGHPRCWRCVGFPVQNLKDVG